MATSKDKPTAKQDAKPEPEVQGWIGERAEDATTGARDD